MGYEGDAHNLKMVKSQVSFNWRYLCHVIIHVFAARKAGWDNMTLELAKGMACLCLNRPFNWARLILENLKFNAQCSLNKKLLLYPRFLELIFQEKLKGIRFEGDVLLTSVMKDRVWNVMRYDHPTSSFSKKFTPLFEEMLTIIGEVSSSEEEEEEEEEEVPSASSTSSSDDNQRMFDPRARKMVEVQRKPPEAVQRTVDACSSSFEDVLGL